MQTPAEQKPKGQRGGARVGTGPRPVDGARGVKRYNVTLDDACEALARELGEGDRSLGIRRALAMARSETV